MTPLTVGAAFALAVALGAPAAAPDDVLLACAAPAPPYAVARATPITAPTLDTVAVAIAVPPACVFWSYEFATASLITESNARNSPVATTCERAVAEPGLDANSVAVVASAVAVPLTVRIEEGDSDAIEPALTNVVADASPVTAP